MDMKRLYKSLLGTLLVFVCSSHAADPWADKVAFITGSSSGLGKALAQEAMDRNMKLVLVDINLAPSVKLAETYRENGGDAIAVQANLAREKPRSKAIRVALDQYGQIDYLFNNAGYNYMARLDQLDLDEAHRLFEVNFWAYVDLARQALPSMKEQGGGTILNVASILGLVPGPAGLGPYAATKHALVGYFQAVAKELEEHNIKVFVAAPAGMKTNIARNSVGPLARGGPRDRADDWEDPAIVATDIFELIQGDQVVFKPGYIGREGN